MSIRIEMTTTGIRVCFDHMSAVHLSANDALELARWVRRKEHNKVLVEKMQQQERKERIKVE